MDDWIWWLLGAALLCIPLVVTAMPEFAMFALGAAAAALSAGLGLSVPLQIVVFLAVSVALLVFVRPIAVRHLTKPAPGSRTGVDALPGQTALVLEAVDEHGGRIKLRGEVWSARALAAGARFEPGEQVSVASIDGATALVL
ncbi:NfeD family protein [Streptacidiphilus monticola]|uniref:NfeD family protein n=1 Tax=Streptacidiphilus monticola TaxID=2161674 RepID=A0ABW1FXW9_9ACTN